MRLKRKTDDTGENNIFWVTMTDLMTALVLVFIVLFFYTYMTSYYSKIQQDIEQNKASQALKESLQEQNIDSKVDISTGIVKISDLSLFTLNSAQLTPSGKAFLTKFSPAYLNSLFSNKYMAEHLDKIIIQGHTDSQTYKGKYSPDEQYMKNMDLSLRRAQVVAEYMMNTQYNKQNGSKLHKMIVVEGASYSDPIIINGKEDYNKSRRVELKLIMKK